MTRPDPSLRVHWRAESGTGNAALIADNRGLVLHTSDYDQSARVRLDDDALRALRHAIDLHLGGDEDGDVW